jgi:hypothetical protein
MNGVKQNIQKWLTHLKSGDVEQGTNALKKGLPNGKYEYCCLGVACEFVLEAVSEKSYHEDGDRTTYEYLFTEQDEDHWTHADLMAYQKFGLQSRSGRFIGGKLTDWEVDEYFPNIRGATLVALNDNGATFAQLVRFMEEQPHRVFTSPEFYPTIERK